MLESGQNLGTSLGLEMRRRRRQKKQTKKTKEEEEEEAEEEEEEGQRDEEQGGKASNETYVPSEPPTDYGSLERSWEYSYDYETLNMAVYDDYRYNLICDVWH